VEENQTAMNFLDSNFGGYLGPIYSVELEIKLKDITHTAKHDSYFKLHI
jgi:hypothetical protein